MAVMRGNNRGRRVRGFTLVEAVVSIVVMAIISIGVVRYITFTAEGYLDTSNRNQLSASGRIVVDRITADVQNALPSSIRISDVNAGDQCMEYIPVRSHTRYIDPPFFPEVDTSFTTFRFVPDVTGMSGVQVVIFPVRTSEIYDGGSPGPRAPVDSVVHQDGNVDEVTLTGPHSFNRRSGQDNAFMVDPPVSYCVQGERMYRYADYGFFSTQPQPDDGSCSPCLPDSTPGRVVIGTDLDNEGFTAFTFGSATRRRNALVKLELNFTRNNESILVTHEILLRLVP